MESPPTKRLTAETGAELQYISREQDIAQQAPAGRERLMVNMTENAKWHWAEGNKYALEAAKAILLVNGAAAIATLTFIGNLKLQPTPALVWSMVIFAVAAVASALLFVFAYLTQLYYGNDNRKWAIRWHTGTYILLLVIVVLFLAGIACAAHGFFRLPHAIPCDLPVKGQ